MSLTQRQRKALDDFRVSLNAANVAAHARDVAQRFLDETLEKDSQGRLLTAQESLANRESDYTKTLETFRECWREVTK